MSLYCIVNTARGSSFTLDPSSIGKSHRIAALVLSLALSGMPFGIATAATLFSSSFETGDVSEWLADSGGSQTGGGYVTSEKAHTGRYSWKAYNDPNLPVPNNYSAKLLRWRFDYQAAYYSGWYFWPGAYKVNGVATEYVNIMQWKSGTPPWEPVWGVSVKGSYRYPGEDEIVVYDVRAVTIFRNNVRLPKDHWFHLEVFLRTGLTGQLIAWLNGQQIFRLDAINAFLSPPSIPFQWGVGNYGQAGIGKYIYVDDAVINSDKAPSPPSNLRIH